MTTHSDRRDAPDRPPAAREAITVEGRFGSKSDLEKAVDRLMARGVPTNTIRVYLVDASGSDRTELPVESGAGVLKGVLIGASVGALVALALVLLVALGAFGSPSIDAIGLRSLAGAIRAIALGAAAGVPLGGLLGMGHWQGARRIRAAELGGRTAVVTVKTGAKADVARNVLEECGARRVTALR